MRSAWVSLLLVSAFGCTDPVLPAPGGGGSGGAGVGGAAGGSGGGSPGVVRVRIVQAQDGAMHANPDVYAKLPLRVAVDGPADQVSVSVGGTTVDAVEGPEGVWVASLDVLDLPDGAVEVAVDASPASNASHAEAELVIARDGVQMTDFAEVGSANTPRLHAVDGALWLTFTDRSSGSPEAWAQRLDGAYRPIGDRVSLAGGTPAASYARTAVAPDGTVGVLYQSVANPYATHFKIMDLAGAELVARIDLDPPGADALSGGDLTYRDGRFCVTFKVASAGSQSLLYACVDLDGAIEGPVTVATSGDGDPDGVFPPFSPVSVEPGAAGSIVAFERELYDASLDFLLPTSHYAVLDDGGAVTATAPLTTESYLFHRETRLATVEGAVIAVYSAVDLLDPSDNPPNLFYAKVAGLGGRFDPGRDQPVFVAVDDRDDPFLLAHPTEHAVMLWTDHRSYTERGIADGRIELFAGPFSEQLRVEDEAMVVFGHARFVAGTSELNGAVIGAPGLGTNVALTWVDERHGQGIADPKPEIYLETAWY